MLRLQGLSLRAEQLTKNDWYQKDTGQKRDLNVTLDAADKGAESPSIKSQNNYLAEGHSLCEARGGGSNNPRNGKTTFAALYSQISGLAFFGPA